MRFLVERRIGYTRRKRHKMIDVSMAQNDFLQAVEKIERACKDLKNSERALVNTGWHRAQDEIITLLESIASRFDGQIGAEIGNAADKVRDLQPS
jgi:hypothetical protein